MATLTGTIHQQVSSRSNQTGTASVTMSQKKCPAKNNKIPSPHPISVGASTSCSSGLTVHPPRAQHPSFPSPPPGMGQPSSQPPTQWWGLWGLPPPWATFTQQNPSYYNNWQQPGSGSYPWPQQQQQQQQSQLSTSTPINQQAGHQSSTMSVPSTPLPPTAAYNDLLDSASSNGSPDKADQGNNALVNVLAVSSVLGIKDQLYMCQSFSNSIKK